MAENTHMRNNALPYPIYGQPFTIVFPLLDADGDPIAPSSADSEISLNGDTAGDCTNEATEISGLTGVCYLDLLAAELTANVVAIETSSTGAKTTINVLYPRKLVTIRTGTANDDGSGTSTIVLDANASAVDDFYNGMAISVVIDAGAPQVRLITDYAGSTKTATVHADFLTAVDNTDTFTIFLPEGHQIQQANVTHAAEVAWASGAITASVIATGAIDADALAADAGTELGTAVWASGTRTLTALDEDDTTIDINTAVAAGVPSAATIADAVWDEDATGHQTGGTFGQAIGDPGADTTTIYQSVVTDAAGTHIAADIIAVKAETATIVADTNELQTDWANGGRLDNILDARASQTSVDDLPTNAELATALGTADDAVLAAVATVDTVVDAIKVQTDKLTFTVANQVDANIESVNGTTVTGSGTEVDPWGP